MFGPVPLTVATLPSFALAVTKNGNGSGTVTGNVNPQINCGATCSQSYPGGTGVTLTASADAGSFLGWSGVVGCPGTAPCAVTVNADTTVTATFGLTHAADLVVENIVFAPPQPVAGEAATVTVTARNQGGLAVTPDFYVDFYLNRNTAPTTSDFGDVACFLSADVAPNGTVDCQQTVTYEAAGTFTAWAQVDLDRFVAESSDDNNVLGPRTVSVRARLTVTKAGAGVGTVTSNDNPQTINCGGT